MSIIMMVTLKSKGRSVKFDIFKLTFLNKNFKYPLNYISIHTFVLAQKYAKSQDGANVFVLLKISK